MPLYWNRFDLTAMAGNALAYWNLPAPANARLINLSENAMFMVHAGNQRAVLRLHRRGYHTYAQINSELAWVASLSDVINLAQPIAGRDGDMVQKIGDDYWVMFSHLPGSHPTPDQDLASQFKTLGGLAARTHIHALEWARPHGFDRFDWDFDAILGDQPRWGHWQDAPNLTASDRMQIEHAVRVVQAQLRDYGQGADRFGLIHGDMRPANVLFDGDTPYVIDFDDAGFGWFMYDFAAAISFFEDRPQIPQLLQAWLTGYQHHRALSDADIAIIPTMVMLRRLALLAWVGSHSDAPEPQELAPHFAADTAKLAARYLKADLM